MAVVLRLAAHCRKSEQGRGLLAELLLACLCHCSASAALARVRREGGEGRKEGGREI
jgi:hypothetical protein